MIWEIISADNGRSHGDAGGLRFFKAICVWIDQFGEGSERTEGQEAIAPAPWGWVRYGEYRTRESAGHGRCPAVPPGCLLNSKLALKTTSLPHHSSHLEEAGLEAPREREFDHIPKCWIE